jgi:hypothetical protein
MGTQLTIVSVMKGTGVQLFGSNLVACEENVLEAILDVLREEARNNFVVNILIGFGGNCGRDHGVSSLIAARLKDALCRP